MQKSEVGITARGKTNAGDDAGIKEVVAVAAVLDHVDRATACIQKGDIASAHTHIEQALKLDPYSEGANGVAACIAYLRAEWEGVVHHSNRAGRVLELSSRPNVYLGRACLQLGRQEEAIEAFERALQIEPSNVEAKAGLLEIRSSKESSEKNALTVDTRLVFTSAECDRIVSFCTPHLKPSALESVTGQAYHTPLHVMTEYLVDVSTPELADAFSTLRDLSREILGDTAQLWSFARFIRYQAGQQFAWHQDDREGRPKGLQIAISVQLTTRNAYEGGELEITDGTDTVLASKDKGSATAFDALLWHRVRKVTRGERFSLVAWGCR